MLRMEALEHGELLKVTLADPFQWRDLNKNLEKEVVRLYLAIHDAISALTANTLSTFSSSPTNDAPTCADMPLYLTIRSIPSNNLSAVTASVHAPHDDLYKSPAREKTMQQDMIGVRLRIEMLENNELLTAGLAAPFWWHELSRDLQSQTISCYCFRPRPEL
jgi:hypothetical protein